MAGDSDGAGEAQDCAARPLRRWFGRAGAFEQIDGITHFAVDPLHPANSRIVDLALAPRNADGLVAFEADFSIVMPVDPARGNKRAIVELPNGGRRRVVAILNCAPHDAPIARAAHPGDGFQSNSHERAHRRRRDYGRDPPQRAAQDVAACRSHSSAAAGGGGRATRAALYVRDYEDGEDGIVPRERWRFARETMEGALEPSLEHIHLEGGFEPGLIYQLVYETDRAPIAGLGLLALRDVAPFLRNPSPGNPTQGNFTSLIAWGISQTGRMLRHFLSLCLNLCEHGITAYDGIQSHVAGARRGAFNHRFAQPSNQTTPLWGHVFPLPRCRRATR